MVPIRSIGWVLTFLTCSGICTLAQTTYAPLVRRTPGLPDAVQAGASKSPWVSALVEEAPGPCAYKPIDLNKPGVACSL